jgi:hypothetical protein
MELDWLTKKLVKWPLILQKYDYDIIHRHGKVMMHPKLFDGLNYESKGENNGRRSWGTLFGSQHFEGKKAC